MDSGIMRNMLIFPSLQDVCNILFTVRIITLIPSVKNGEHEEGGSLHLTMGAKK